MAKSRLSNVIAEFLQEMMEETQDGMIEIQRNVLAQHFDCSPSQINYVLQTRFTPYRGYYIESRRGGGGFIRIVKVAMDQNDADYAKLLMDTIGDSITKDKARHIIDGLREEGLITDREARIMLAAVSDRAINCVGELQKNNLRARILQNVLIIAMEQEESQ